MSKMTELLGVNFKDDNFLKKLLPKSGKPLGPRYYIALPKVYNYESLKYEYKYFLFIS